MNTKATGTQGAFTVDVIGHHTLSFEGDADEMQLNKAVDDDQASGTFYCTFNKDKSDEFKVVDGLFSLVKVSD
ncbi:hypothetical protein N2A98_13140 [Pseudomonas sp. FJ2-5-13]|uniref:hypothetical protein n=1 Tax=Pseudomonas sp. FJ2-5-13 TaxID=2976884 RepID=UPI0023D8C514|nr:hypothetical protein [Pseudomonas sp. FJ2-5-13]WEJ08190.1 hypothetical protein N2A98_13140 [Pseudomonas sp. FJ2-5-13]